MTSSIDDLEENLSEIVTPLDYKLQVLAFLLLGFGLAIGANTIQIKFRNFLSAIPGVSFSVEAKKNEPTPISSPSPSNSPTPEIEATASSPTSEAEQYKTIMEFILKWEGGCSDDPADRGGRTYKGIITEVAKANGWSGDVCKMPDSKIMDIYKKDYWNQVAAKYPWPLSFPLMNTSVNSGPGIAQDFLKEMPKSITDPWEQTFWLANRMKIRYDRIVAKNPSQKRFYKGWINRNNDLTKILKQEHEKWQGKLAQPVTK